MIRKTLSCLAAVVAVATLSASPASAQLQFSGPVNYAAGAPGFVATGDLNGDGRLDRVVLNTGDHTVSILLGNGDGTLQSGITHPVGSTASFIAVGDFNGDGKLDLVVANGSSNTVSVMLGNGDGTIQGAVQYNIGSSADFVAVADFNNDKKMDLLVSSWGSTAASNPTTGSFAILLGNGDGTFQAVKVTSTGSMSSTPYVAIADFNGDGNLDVATDNGVSVPLCLNGTNCLKGNVIVIPGNGDGTFQSSVTSALDFEPKFLLTGDFNGDGKADLVIIGLEAFSQGHEFPVLDQEVISTVLSKGDGTFGTPIGVAALPRAVPLCHGEALATNVAVADLNGDARLDGRSRHEAQDRDSY